MEQLDLFKKSWGVHEGFQKLQEQLDERIPLEGSVPSPRSTNKHLEKFRVASNLAYDLFNNGLMNQRKEFASIFGMRYAEVPVPTIRSQIAFDAKINWEYCEDTIAPRFREIIHAAACEQFGIHYYSNIIIGKVLEEDAA